MLRREGTLGFLSGILIAVAAGMIRVCGAICQRDRAQVHEGVSCVGSEQYAARVGAAHRSESNTGSGETVQPKKCHQLVTTTWTRNTPKTHRFKTARGG